VPYGLADEALSLCLCVPGRQAPMSLVCPAIYMYTFVGSMAR
jgi:hypothetical protein